MVEEARKAHTMTTSDFIEWFEEKTKKMNEVCRAKNADYANSISDPFANFSRVEALGIASTEQGFLTRMLDKFCRISTFVDKGVLKVKDESVEDTLIDLANYSLLLAGYIEKKKREQSHNSLES